MFVEDTGVRLDDATTTTITSPSPTTSDTQGETCTQQLTRVVSTRNWTRPLRFASFLCGLGLMVAGLTGMIPSPLELLATLNPLHYLVCACVILFGALLDAVLIPFPSAWKRLNMKWVPFLHTNRGRGFFLMFLGALSTGLGILALIIGILVFLVGVVHIFLACYFRDTLDPSTDFDEFSKRVGTETIEEKVQDGVTIAAVTNAWNNNTLFTTMWDGDIDFSPQRAQPPATTSPNDGVIRI
eukprot:TRINITY_DN10755_c0_g3_i1.p1 TRINITY_DN10755_c0_g3~~TRINITY_DN10755_c0_g3_i1.p1  ORF type:complete len:241 (-),score=41.70 TRINITY_DN10755_c0_g3_i1:162-884(-)